MAGITSSQAQIQLDLWIAADTTVANGQSYSIGNRSLTRADAEEITSKIKFWSGLVTKLSRGGATARRVVPRDL